MVHKNFKIGYPKLQCLDADGTRMDSRSSPRTARETWLTNSICIRIAHLNIACV